MSNYISRREYVNTFGPTIGDRIRLADTDLFIEVEKDYTTYPGPHYGEEDYTTDRDPHYGEEDYTTDRDPHYGDEVKFGGGKVIRDGMGQSPISNAAGAVDLVITNALILDWWGIVKADIGIKEGKIVEIGKAGNPYTQDGINIIIGPGTEVIAGEGKILTAGAIDTHIHFICPQQIDTALASGTTTMIGGGTGPATGTLATTCTPGPWNIYRMLQAAEALPINIGLLGKGNTSKPEGLIEQVKAGVMGLKVHEDWGATAAAIDNCLTVADLYDVQVAIHTDSLNEAGFVETTIAAFKDRVIHTFHTEGAGGGHSPDILKVCSYDKVLPASTNPTRPYTINTFDEHKDMLMVCHHLDKNIPEDVKFAESRIRKETIAAEDLLHDMGAISIMSSDSQAMGRVGEVIIRTWQTAHKMKVQKGLLPEPNNLHETHDNFRAKRYVAKYTINPAIAHGISHFVGSIEKGKLADLCLWKPAFFGVKPEIVMKGGMIAWAQVGDANASISTPEPVYMRPMFATFGKATANTSFTFVSQAALEHDIAAQLGLNPKRLVAVSNTRNVSKKDLKLNDATPEIEVDPETFDVRVDGKLLTCEPATSLPMAQRYFLF